MKVGDCFPRKIGDSLTAGRNSSSTPGSSRQSERTSASILGNNNPVEEHLATKMSSRSITSELRCDQISERFANRLQGVS
mgnify:CR=1 FL=1